MKIKDYPHVIIDPLYFGKRNCCGCQSISKYPHYFAQFGDIFHQQKQKPTIFSHFDCRFFQNSHATYARYLLLIARIKNTASNAQILIDFTRTSVFAAHDTKRANGRDRTVTPENKHTTPDLRNNGTYHGHDGTCHHRVKIQLQT